MRIDAQKPARLVAALALVAAGCNSLPIKPPPQEGGASISATAVPTEVPELCRVPAETFRPQTLSIAAVATYPGGVVVNQIGEIADLIIGVPQISRINGDPNLGLGLTRDILHITYFVTGSFHRPEILAQLQQAYAAQARYFLARHCENQGWLPKDTVFIGISGYDALDVIIKRDPSLSADDPSWPLRLGREFGSDYIYGTSANLQRMPGRSKGNISADAVDAALQAGLPFRVAKFNPDSLRGLIPQPQSN